MPLTSAWSEPYLPPAAATPERHNIDGCRIERMSGCIQTSGSNAGASLNGFGAYRVITCA